MKRKVDFYLVGLAILLSLFFNKEVNQVVEFLIPKVTLEIKVPEGETKGLVLLQTDKKIKFPKNTEKTEKEIDIEYIPAGKYGYHIDALWIKNSKKNVKVEIKKMPNVKLSFFNIGGDKAELIFKEGRQILDLKDKKNEIIDYFPFKNSKRWLAYTLLSYLFLILVFYSLLWMFFGNIGKIEVEKKNKYKKIFFEYTPWKMVFILYILIMIYVSYRVLTNSLPSTLFHNSNEFFGDQGDYWILGKNLKDRDYLSILKNNYTFRGYMTFIIPSIAQMIGEKLKISSYWIYLLISNIFPSILLGYILPEINNKISDKKAKNYHIIILFLIFSLFWKGMYYSILVDILGVTFLLWMILEVLKKKNFFIAGIFGGIAGLCRGNYVWTIIILFLTTLIYELYKNIKINKKNIILFFLGIIFICIPQIKINYDLGHIGIFPFDKVGSYVKEEKLTVFLINETMRNLFIGHPFNHSDVTAQAILEQFSSGSRLDMMQIFLAFISSPIETLIMIVKKLFAGLDLRSNEVYPMKLMSLTWFNFLNYFIISTSLFFIIFQKKFLKREKKLGILLFFSTVLPQTILHVEWRYYILLYLMVYYIFVFKFTTLIENYEEFEEIKSRNYFKVITILIILFFVISSYYL